MQDFFHWEYQGVIWPENDVMMKVGKFKWYLSVTDHRWMFQNTSYIGDLIPHTAKSLCTKETTDWGHSWSSIIQLLLVDYFEPYLSQCHGSRHAVCFLKVCFNFDLQYCYLSHSNKEVVVSICCISCRFRFKSWFVYFDLRGNAEDEDSKPPIEPEYCMTCQMMTFPAWSLHDMCHGRLKRLQANQAMKLGKWTRYWKGVGLRRFTFDVYIYIELYTYVYNKAIH